MGNGGTQAVVELLRAVPLFSELSELVSLDPLSGLEPTTREIEQTRLFAERTLFYLQRVPLILNRRIAGLDESRRWRNFDAFDLALNRAQ